MWKLCNFHDDHHAWTSVLKSVGQKTKRFQGIFYFRDTPPRNLRTGTGMTVQEFVNVFGDGDSKALQVGEHRVLCTKKKIPGNISVLKASDRRFNEISTAQDQCTMYFIIIWSSLLKISMWQCTPCRVDASNCLRCSESQIRRR
jgi:hypothetical protein